MYTAYKIISDHYGDRVAKRSQVPLINHIDEGLGILEELLPGDRVVKRAFCLHPLVQDDDELEKNYQFLAEEFYGDTILYVMEYRNIANQSLSDIVAPCRRKQDECALLRPIKLSPIREVNAMLIADKVQNKADFEIYHKGVHARSKELEFYFDSWLRVLGVSNDDYLRLVKAGKESTIREC